jgi:predicted transposase YdaD
MQVLWLKFLTEINEKTVDVDPELLKNPEISKALDICTYLTQEELLGYDRYWDAISTAKTLASGKYKDGLDAGLAKGREEGRAEGRAEGEKLGIEKGEKQKAIKMARKLKLKGTMSDEEIAEITDLTLDEIQKI